MTNEQIKAAKPAILFYLAEKRAAHERRSRRCGRRMLSQPTMPPRNTLFHITFGIKGDKNG